MLITFQARPLDTNSWKYHPLDFVSNDEWYCNTIWRYNTQLLHWILNLVIPSSLLLWLLPPYLAPRTSRPIDRIMLPSYVAAWPLSHHLDPHIFKPNDRIRSDNFPVHDYVTEFICGATMILYSAIFASGVGLTFPSGAERIMWIIASTTMLAFAVFGGLYFLWLDYRVFRPPQNRLPEGEPTEPGLSGAVRRRLYGFLMLICGDLSKQDAVAATVWIDSRQIVHIPSRILVPIQICNAAYCIARVYVLVEDIIGLRSLPLSAFATVDWSLYLPRFS